MKRDGTKVAKDNWVWKSMCEKAKLTMNSANRRTFENDWRAWYQAVVSAITSSRLFTRTHALGRMLIVSMVLCVRSKRAALTSSRRTPTRMA